MGKIPDRWLVASAPIAGALITFMYVVNGRLAAAVGNLAATLIVHAVGLAAAAALVLAGGRRVRGRAEHLPIYYYLGGSLGVGTVFAANYAFVALDASLAVALALLGQSVFSAVADSVGILGRPKRAFGAGRLPGMGLAAIGVAVMAGDWNANAPAMFVAFLAGVLPGLTTILNAEYGRKRGVLRGVRLNYLTGLATTILVVLLARPSLGEAASAVLRAGPFLALSGGLLGIAVVASLNLVVARIPAFTATLLTFSGQAATALVIDLAARGGLETARLIGLALLLLGLALDTMVSRNGKEGARLPTPVVDRLEPR